MSSPFDYKSLPLAECPLIASECDKWLGVINPFLKYAGSPGDWGYNSKLGMLTQRMLQVREELQRERALHASATEEAAATRAKRLKIAAAYWDWLQKHGRGTSFSTFVNEFGYQADDCKKVYEAVVLPCFETFKQIECLPEQEAL